MYAKASKLALEAGFDGVDVKCCHGYLFNELLSAYNREGSYGGSLENRTRLYFDCIDAVKEAVGDNALSQQDLMRATVFLTAMVTV